jgi:hypothetical protein
MVPPKFSWFIMVYHHVRILKTYSNDHFGTLDYVSFVKFGYSFKEIMIYSKSCEFEESGSIHINVIVDFLDNY